MGQMLVCSVIATPGEPAVMLVAPAPVANMEGLDASLQVLKAKPSAEFNVVVVQRNGEMQDRREARGRPVGRWAVAPCLLLPCVALCAVALFARRFGGVCRPVPCSEERVLSSLPAPSLS